MQRRHIVPACNVDTSYQHATSTHLTSMQRRHIVPACNVDTSYQHATSTHRTSMQRRHIVPACNVDTSYQHATSTHHTSMQRRHIVPACNVDTSYQHDRDAALSLGHLLAQLSLMLLQILCGQVWEEGKWRRDNIMMSSALTVAI